MYINIFIVDFFQKVNSKSFCGSNESALRFKWECARSSIEPWCTLIWTPVHFCLTPRSGLIWARSVTCHIGTYRLNWPWKWFRENLTTRIQICLLFYNPMTLSTSIAIFLLKWLLSLDYKSHIIFLVHQGVSTFLRLHCRRSPISLAGQACPTWKCTCVCLADFSPAGTEARYRQYMQWTEIGRDLNYNTVDQILRVALMVTEHLCANSNVLQNPPIWLTPFYIVIIFTSIIKM